MQHLNGNEPPQRSLVWLVTGCSSGFGSNIVNAALARGDKVVATARNPAQLECLQNQSNVAVLQLDVTASQTVLSDKAQEAVAAFGRIDVLVNNAGYVLSGVWEELRPEDVLKQFETNVFGAMNLTRAILPHMRQRRTGTIFFMGSIAGWHGVAGGGAYSASKYALEGAVECLAKELAPIGIRVHQLVIGLFRTNILDPSKNVSVMEAGGIPEYAEIKELLARRHATTQGSQPGDPLLAAQRIVDIARLENMPHQEAGQLPLRIPLGSDAVRIVREKCLSTLATFEEWESFASSTDFGAKGAVPDYQ